MNHIATGTLSTQMPSHGVDIIDGIPVYLKGDVMYAFRPEVASTPAQATLRLGTYNADTKKATWLLASEQPDMDTWLHTFRENLAARSRK
jgi:hypothetical protein